MKVNVYVSMTGVDILKPVNTSLLGETLCTLGRDWPHSIHIYYFILNFVDWTPHVKRVDFSYYAPRGDPIDGAYLAIAKFKYSVTYVMVHIDETSSSDLELILRNTTLIDWSRPLIFEGVHDRVMPTLKKILHEKNVKIISEDTVLQLWLPPRLVENVTLDPRGPDVCVRRLHVRNVKAINDNWKHKFPGSLLMIQDYVRQNIALGMFIKKNDTPVSWAVEQHYGGIGIVYTMEEYRGRGYATAVLKTMIQSLERKNIDPFVCIEHSNAESLRLFRRLKFQDICNVTWLLTDGIIQTTNK